MFPPQCNKDQGEDTERQVKKLRTFFLGGGGGKDSAPRLST